MGVIPAARARTRIFNFQFFILNFSALAFAFLSSASAQIPFQAGWKYRSGQNVVPAFEGWEKNPDGSFDMIFGYFNRNYEETLDIPAGPNNSVEPGGPDQGQPTFFLPARRRFFFRVRVPKDWPSTRKLVWTLTVRGKTEKANAFLLPEWELNTSAIQGSLSAAMDPLNKAPEISVDPKLQTQTIPLSGTATLTASGTDDGRPLRRVPAGRGAATGGATGGLAAPATEPGARPSANVVSPGNLQTAPAAQTTPAPLRVEWLQYRGPAGGRASFEPPIATVADGKASTTASFSMPGRYIVRAFLNDGAVTTPADFTITVTGR